MVRNTSRSNSNSGCALALSAIGLLLFNLIRLLWRAWMSEPPAQEGRVEKKTEESELSHWQSGEIIEGEFEEIKSNTRNR